MTTIANLCAWCIALSARGARPDGLRRLSPRAFQAHSVDGARTTGGRIRGTTGCGLPPSRAPMTWCRRITHDHPDL